MAARRDGRHGDLEARANRYTWQSAPQTGLAAAKGSRRRERRHDGGRARRGGGMSLGKKALDIRLMFLSRGRGREGEERRGEAIKGSLFLLFNLLAVSKAERTNEAISPFAYERRAGSRKAANFAGGIQITGRHSNKDPVSQDNKLFCGGGRFSYLDC